MKSKKILYIVISVLGILLSAVGGAFLYRREYSYEVYDLLVSNVTSSSFSITWYTVDSQPTEVILKRGEVNTPILFGKTEWFDEVEVERVSNELGTIDYNKIVKSDIFQRVDKYLHTVSPRVEGEKFTVFVKDRMGLFWKVDTIDVPNRKLADSLETPQNIYFSLVDETGAQNTDYLVNVVAYDISGGDYWIEYTGMTNSSGNVVLYISNILSTTGETLLEYISKDHENKNNMSYSILITSPSGDKWFIDIADVIEESNLGTFFLSYVPLEDDEMSGYPEYLGKVNLLYNEILEDSTLDESNLDSSMLFGAFAINNPSASSKAGPVLGDPGNVDPSVGKKKGESFVCQNNKRKCCVRQYDSALKIEKIVIDSSNSCFVSNTQQISANVGTASVQTDQQAWMQQQLVCCKIGTNSSNKTRKECDSRSGQVLHTGQCTSSDRVNNTSTNANTSTTSIVNKAVCCKIGSVQIMTTSCKQGDSGYVGENCNQSGDVGPVVNSSGEINQTGKTKCCLVSDKATNVYVTNDGANCEDKISDSACSTNIIGKVGYIVNGLFIVAKGDDSNLVCCAVEAEGGYKAQSIDKSKCPTRSVIKSAKCDDSMEEKTVVVSGSSTGGSWSVSQSNNSADKDVCCIVVVSGQNVAQTRKMSQCSANNNYAVLKNSACSLDDTKYVYIKSGDKWTANAKAQVCCIENKSGKYFARKKDSCVTGNTVSQTLDGNCPSAEYEYINGKFVEKKLTSGSNSGDDNTMVCCAYGYSGQGGYNTGYYQNVGKMMLSECKTKHSTYKVVEVLTGDKKCSYEKYYFPVGTPVVESKTKADNSNTTDNRCEVGKSCYSRSFRTNTYCVDKENRTLFCDIVGDYNYLDAKAYISDKDGNRINGGVWKEDKLKIKVDGEKVSHNIDIGLCIECGSSRFGSVGLSSGDSEDEEYKCVKNGDFWGNKYCSDESGDKYVWIKKRDKKDNVAYSATSIKKGDRCDEDYCVCSLNVEFAGAIDTIGDKNSLLRTVIQKDQLCNKDNVFQTKTRVACQDGLPTDSYDYRCTSDLQSNILHLDKSTYGDILAYLFKVVRANEDDVELINKNIMFEYDNKNYTIEIGNEIPKTIEFFDEVSNTYKTIDIEEFKKLTKKDVISKKQVLNLSKGFNLVSIPLMKNIEPFSAMDIYNVLKIQDNKLLVRIAEYNGTWKMYGDTNLGELNGNDFWLVPGRGYLIYVNDDINLVLEGSDVSKYISKYRTDLITGWNLIGLYGATESFTAEKLIDSINEYQTVDFTAENISKFDVSKQRYDGLQKEKDSEGKTEVYGFDYKLNNGTGYFVKVVSGKGTYSADYENMK